jgi:hypothetical protein
VRPTLALSFVAVVGCVEPAPPTIAAPVTVVEINAHASAPSPPSCAPGTRWDENAMECVAFAQPRPPPLISHDEAKPEGTPVMGVLFDPCALLTSPNVAESNCDPLQGLELAASDAGVVWRADAN